MSCLPTQVVSESFDHKSTGEAINYLKNNRNVKKIVFFDDASYSGKQMGNYVEALQKQLILNGMNDVEIIIAIPYMSNISASKLSNIDGINIHISDHNRILTLSESFPNKTDTDFLKTISH